MKNLILILTLVSLFSCKNTEDRFIVDVSKQDIQAKIIDISADVYNLDIPFDSLKIKYPFFYNDTASDETFQAQRKDSLERMLYGEIRSTIHLDSLQMELTTLFQHIQYYYPKFESPTVFVFSSALNEDYKYNPVRYYKEYNTLIIALDYFLGKDSEYYKVFKVENYLRESMNPENITPKSSLAIAETFPLMDVENNQFLNYVVTYGKVYLLQDAFLPGYSDALKISYTPKQINWCYANQRNMWDYFIQQDYLFSDDKDLLRRFIHDAPFSKFYIMDENNQSIDTESPGGVGRWIGWQILRQYTQENPKVELLEIMANRNFEQIFRDSKYQPQ